MNLCGFEFDEKTVGVLGGISESGRLPHALLIEGKGEKPLELAALLSAYAVCEKNEKPCGACKQCKNALEKTHADIKYLPPDKSEGRKTETYSIKQIRELIADASIKPNSGKAKVYILERCDTRLAAAVTQNALLKLIEEPPKNVYFFFLCESARSLLGTVQSRCMKISLKSEKTFSEEATKSAEEIAAGILSPRGYELLLALRTLENKKYNTETLEALSLLLRDALVLGNGGRALGNSEVSKRLAAKLTAKKLISSIELCQKAKKRLEGSVNIKLLAAWLCSEFRRISWQR